MPSREDLHKLVDTLPAGAFDAVLKTLQHLQTWPPVPPEAPPEVAELFRLTPEERAARVREMAGGGLRDARWQIRQGRDGQKGRRGTWSTHRSEGDVMICETHRFFDEHEFTIIERFAPEERGLAYCHEITGPNGQSETREIIFPIKLAPGSCAL